jgi:hypothetical protein
MQGDETGLECQYHGWTIMVASMLEASGLDKLPEHLATEDLELLFA